MPYSDTEPLAVKPHKAATILDCSLAQIYRLLNAGELQGFRDGRSTKVTMSSIRARLTRLLETQPFRKRPVGKAARTEQPQQHLSSTNRREGAS